MNNKQYYEIKVITSNFKANLLSQLQYIFKKDSTINILDHSLDTVWLEVALNEEIDNLILFPTLFTRFGTNWKVSRGLVINDTVQLQYTYTPDGNASDRVIMQTVIPFKFNISEYKK